MKYNVFVSTRLSTYTVLDITVEELNVVVDAYKQGKETFFLNGKKYWLNNFFEIQIYSFEHPHIKTGDALFEYCNRNRFLMGYEKYIPIEILKQFGTQKTNDFIKGGFGDERNL
jgi:hypothetical protein